jgi:SAM-dependent methyltransferase
VTDIRAVLTSGDLHTRQAFQSLGGSIIVNESDLVIMSLPNSNPAVKRSLSSHGMVKIFENTYVTTNVGDDARRGLIAGYFDWLDTEYLREIDVARNNACYDRLFEEGCGNLAKLSRLRVLDVGCGPATILRTSIPVHAHALMGYDISTAMRKQATQAGIAVMDRNEFEHGAWGADIALSVYVMHYEADNENLISSVYRHLKVNGRWAMNFHKGMGLENFRRRSSTQKELVIVKSVPDSPFGPLIVMQRRGK